MINTKYEVLEVTYHKEPCIGYIVQCRKDDDFGIIYGVQYNNGTQLEYDKLADLFYFKKKKQVSYKPYTIVSYLQENYKQAINNEVSDVIAIDDFQIININDRNKRRFRKKGYFCTDKEWKLIQYAIPFINKTIPSGVYTIWHPQICEDTNKVEYHVTSYYNLFNDANKPISSILSCYFILKEYGMYEQTLPMDFLANEISKIHKYVKKFDIHEEAKKFISGHSGYFKCCPGRDDMFIMKDYKTTSSKDDFIRGLVNLGVKTDYYSCVGRGPGDDDYDNIDESETKKLRNEVCKIYDKDKHYTFLLKTFIEKQINNAERYKLAKKRLYSFINKDLFDKDFTEENYRNIIKNFHKNNHRIVCIE